MGKIFCIIGKSSTGKDMVFKRLLAEPDLALSNVVSYTTRPIRAGEEEGVEYFFCTQQKEQELEQQGKVIERRTYHTRLGDWDYFTVDDGQVNLADGNYLIIGTLESYLALRNYYGNQALVPIYIEVEDGKRLEHAIHREKQQEVPKYEELCRRFLADAEDFSEEKLRKAGVNRRFCNDGDKDEIVAKIADYIRRCEAEERPEGDPHGYQGQ